MANETDARTGTTGEAAAGAGDGALQLGGYGSPKALADGLTATWTDAVSALSTGAIERHVREVLRDTALGDDIAEIAKDKSIAEDTRLFRVILRLDPHPNPQFMGYELSEQGLAELAAEVDGPFPTWSATAALRIMYTDRVLTLCAEATKTPRFRELDDRWHLEFEAWSRLTAKSTEAGGPDVFSKAAWHTRARVLRGLIDTKDEEPLRARAREAMKKPTVAEWAREVGSLEGAGVGSLMGVADLGEAAEVYDANRKAERKAAASSRRRGVLSGVVSIALVVGVVLGIAAFANQKQADILFPGNSPTPSPTVTKSIDPATATVIGTATITKDTNLLDAPDAGANVVQPLKTGDRVFQIAHDQNGFYEVRLASDEKVFGFVDKNDAAIICPVQCG